MSVIENLNQANEARERELNPWPSPIWSFPELSEVENSVITKARLDGYAGFFPCMNGGLDQARKTLAGAREFLADRHNSYGWIRPDAEACEICGKKAFATPVDGFVVRECTNCEKLICEECSDTDCDSDQDGYFTTSWTCKGGCK